MSFPQIIEPHLLPTKKESGGTEAKQFYSRGGLPKKAWFKLKGFPVIVLVAL